MMYYKILRQLFARIILNGFFKKFDQHFWYSLFLKIPNSKNYHTISTKLLSAMTHTPRYTQKKFHKNIHGQFLGNVNTPFFLISVIAQPSVNISLYNYLYRSRQQQPTCGKKLIWPRLITTK